MAKKTTRKRAAASKRARGAKKGAARRKAPRRPGGAPKAATPSAGGLRLKELRGDVQKAMKHLENTGKKDSLAYQRMQQWSDDMGWLCDPENPDGCGPVMVFPNP